MSEVSIIVPIYNSEKYISACIESILHQTYKDFELLLIDDGSTDNTNNIIKKYKDSRIKIYRQENKGTGAARNLGMKHANGNYLTFVDSDDAIEQRYLEIMLNACKNNNADIVSCVYMKNDKEPKTKILNNTEAFRYLISLPEKIPMSVVR